MNELKCVNKAIFNVQLVRLYISEVICDAPLYFLVDGLGNCSENS